MGFTDLLEELTRLGPSLAGEPRDLGSTTLDARNEVNAAIFPVWQWLDGLTEAADQNGIPWADLDSAPADDSIEAVRASINVLRGTVERGDVDVVRSELRTLGSRLATVAIETDAQLKRLGVDEVRRNRLLLPLHAHVSELAVTAGSSEALSLARESLGQVGEKQLSKGIAEKVEYEQRRADSLRYSAIAAFIFSIGWLVASYLAFRSSDFASGGDGLSEAAAKLGIGAAVLGLAVYLAKESQAHRERESSWQSVELQMDTINLYCASLPIEHRDAIRLSFGLEVFSGSKLFGELGGGNTSPGGTGKNGQRMGPSDLEQAVALASALGRRSAATATGHRATEQI
jgi:hypothetical protein